MPSSLLILLERRKRGFNAQTYRIGAQACEQGFLRLAWRRFARCRSAGRRSFGCGCGNDCRLRTRNRSPCLAGLAELRLQLCGGTEQSSKTMRSMRICASGGASETPFINELGSPAVAVPINRHSSMGKEASGRIVIAGIQNIVQTVFMHCPGLPSCHRWAWSISPGILKAKSNGAHLPTF